MAEKIAPSIPAGSVEKSPDDLSGHGFALIRLAARSGLIEPALVSVGVNGQRFKMQRGRLIPVPAYVVGALNDAVYPTYTEEEDEVTNRRVFEGMTHRYPFEVIRKLDQSKYDALRTIALERDIRPEDLQQLGM